MEPVEAPASSKIPFEVWKQRADEALRAKKAAGEVLPAELQEMLAMSTAAQYEAWLRRKSTIDIAIEVPT